MRVNLRIRDERGATAVLLALTLVVLIGIVALSIDGGLLLSKYRQVRRASDAGALAAAISCGKQEPPDPTGKAIASAGTYTAANVDTTAPAAPAPTVTFKNLNGTPVSPQSCNGMSAGKVTVQYTVQQPLIFGPAIGVSSPKPVSASATAIWGAAGGANNVVPLMISFRNTDCNIPNGTPPQTCHFWIDDDFPGLSTFGIMNLSTWGYAAGQTCPSGGQSADLNTAIDSGWPDALLLTTNPTYVCGVNDNSVHANVASHINNILPHSFLFPVNAPALQVPPCPNGSTTCAAPDKYAIIGFAEMTVTRRIENNNQAQTLCAGVSSPGSGGNYRCIEAVWTGWNTTGYSPGGGTNFGTIAVTLGQ
jgi:Flp pilus assembly protein TadG